MTAATSAGHHSGNSHDGTRKETVLTEIGLVELSGHHPIATVTVCEPVNGRPF
jgi:hypothetical protein